MAEIFCALCRLLDVHCSKGRYEHELIVYMVFEYMEQDLDKFIRQSRLDHKLTKVNIFSMCTYSSTFQFCHFSCD